MDRLMDKLSNDDGFRAQLMADPVSTLGTLGIKLDAAQIPAIRNLPSKQAIAIDRLAVKQKLDNAAGAIPFFLSGRA
jgi:putative modified peptide